MIKKLAASAICAFAVSPCLAAHWYMFNNVNTPQGVSFFDGDSVGRDGTVVTVWLKNVFDPSKVTTKIYSIASRETFDCAKRVNQTVAMTGYGKDGDVLASGDQVGPLKNIIPGSIGEDELQIICAPGFPSTSPATRQYFPAINNDPIGMADIVFKRRAAKQAEPASN